MFNVPVRRIVPVVAGFGRFPTVTRAWQPALAGMRTGLVKEA
jgi:hypothetical protein